LPALSLPFGFSPTGLPVGIQIIGQPGADLGVLQLAKHIESQHPVWREVPRLEQGSQP
jgi:amidase